MNRTHVLWLITALFPVTAFAFEVPPNDGYVTDTARLLSAAEEQELEGILDAEYLATSNEIAILIIPSLQGESIVEASVETLRTWGVGTDENNGIIILLAYDDREIMISPGYGLEGALPDIAIGGIIDRDMTPQFRDGNYFEGLRTGVESIRKHIAGEYTVERYSEAEGSGVLPFIFFVGFMILEWFAALFARTKSWWLGGIVGACAGFVLFLIFTWWLAIPLLTMLGLIFDFIVSKMPVSTGRRSSSAWWMLQAMSGSRGGMGSRRSGFRGFGGGTGGGAGARRKW